MPFVVKDLMISVLQGNDNLGLGGRVFATDHSCGGCCLTPCSLPSCPNNSCVGITDCSLGRLGADVVNPADLAVLKQILKNALSEVELREAVLKQVMRPQTLDDVEALEERLKGAIQELQLIKKDLKNQPGG